jgi:hypothetical protein
MKPVTQHELPNTIPRVLFKNQFWLLKRGHDLECLPFLTATNSSSDELFLPKNSLPRFPPSLPASCRRDGVRSGRRAPFPTLNVEESKEPLSFGVPRLVPAVC